MNRIGIENMSVFDLAPVQFVELTARLGCANISINVGGGYENYSLKDDTTLRRDMNAAMRDHGVSISLGDGFLIRPDGDIGERAADFDWTGELGVTRVNAVSIDPDIGRSFDQFAKFAEMAGAAGAEALVELCPILAIRDLPMALDLVRHVGRPNFKLLIDTMHLIRSGSSPADLAAVDPGIIGYVQICDVPLTPTIPDYMQEAMTTRLPPGRGGLPLLDILSVLPRHLVLGIETPMRREADAGTGHYERLAPSVRGVRDLLAQLDA